MVLIIKETLTFSQDERHDPNAILQQLEISATRKKERLEEMYKETLELDATKIKVQKENYLHIKPLSVNDCGNLFLGARSLATIFNSIFTRMHRSKALLFPCCNFYFFGLVNAVRPQMCLQYYCKRILLVAFLSKRKTTEMSRYRACHVFQFSKNS